LSIFCADIAGAVGPPRMLRCTIRRLAG
jgi:hypothetical protein